MEGWMRPDDHWSADRIERERADVYRREVPEEKRRRTLPWTPREDGDDAPKRMPAV